jgi:hypothetical protein
MELLVVTGVSEPKLGGRLGFEYHALLLHARNNTGKPATRKQDYQSLPFFEGRTVTDPPLIVFCAR